ncbi:MAG: hypothetical protein A3G51_03965 [Candidatus Yanofskybacteria bacterium RIFCSPLOWO2_12_FULL_43_11b]|uniref:ASCH domain-containing protein n=1 Tax=Candidatus Yanofskybacteria bacterium RIFCSPLOWO2_12_FULL_43_11b TaxID=1802710 RepID=A0A1F8HBD5_9BACT|nr:MAG: hypothetical protein A3G51_03965 [Candidatus Yanofskybacteria bacterium RIFCSPLOWO2_12_FULL_43_11b]
MKTLKFKSHLVNQILNGSKTVTWRLFDDKDLKRGDVFCVLNSDTGENISKAVIVEIKEKKLGQVKDEDFDGHEKYQDQDDMLEHYRKYYGDKVNLDTTVKIIKFRLVNE